MTEPMGVRGRQPETGMVTVELAAALLLLTPMLVGCLAVAGGVFAVARCQLVANEVARQEARGDAAGAARAAAEAPSGARVVTSHADGATEVTVQLDVAVGPGRIPVEARARVLDEGA